MKTDRPDRPGNRPGQDPQPTRPRTSNQFTLGLVIAVGLAWLVPSGGSSGGFLHPELLTRLAVPLVFFLHGARLTFQALRRGSAAWRLHLLIQVTTFVFFPLVGLAGSAVLHHLVPADLVLGLFFLCAVPSTVTSAVVFTALVRGNVAVALFNATTSNLIGVVVTPLWMTTVLVDASAAAPLGETVLDLVRWLVLPFVAGQLARRWIGAWLEHHRTAASRVDQYVVLFLVHASFCDAFVHDVWHEVGTRPLLIIAAAIVVLLALAKSTTLAAASALRLSPADRAPVVFCGSQKTLAAGVPMAQLLLPNYPKLGLVLLPLLLYHPLQLIVGGWMAGRWSRAEL